MSVVDLSVSVCRESDCISVDDLTMSTDNLCVCFALF